jgi:hypothetical protein
VNAQADEQRDPDQLWLLIHGLRKECAGWRAKYQLERRERERLQIEMSGLAGKEKT